MPGLPTRVLRRPRRRRVRLQISCLLPICCSLFCTSCTYIASNSFDITGKYTALIAVLVVGSFIIPMAQYFWYVKDDDSSEKFFQKAAEPEPEPKKKGGGWFGGGKV